MNRSFLTITIFLILTVLPIAIFAQSSDDADGDGVNNSEDVCPNDKGTKANKGCPSEEKELTPKEIKKQKEKLDSLKSNIDIFATPTPTPTPTPKPITASTPNTTANVRMAPNCRYILDFEKCRNILFVMSREEIVQQFGTAGIQKYDLSSEYRYKGMTIDVATADFIYGVEFNGFDWNDDKLRSPFTQWIPAEDIRWGDGKDKIIKKFGNADPQKIKGVNGEKFEYYRYDGDKLTFQFTNGKLTKIELKRKISDDEYAKSLKIYKLREIEIEARKTPEQRKKENPYGVSLEIRNAFDLLHDQVESLTNTANKIVRDYNANQYIYDSLGQRYGKERSVSSLHIQAADLIRKFLTDHKGSLPKAMISHLKSDIESLFLGEGH